MVCTFEPDQPIEGSHPPLSIALVPVFSILIALFLGGDAQSVGRGSFLLTSLQARERLFDLVNC